MDGTRVGRWWPVAIVASLLVSGCAMFQDDEPNFRDDTAKWGESVRRNQAAEPPNRPVSLNSAFGGVTTEAQQIERNLGIK